jgi:hypothetical protein
MLTGVLMVAALCGVAWLLLIMHEPIYQGRALSAWLDQYGTNHWGPRNGDLGRKGNLDKEAQIAIRTIGTNAVPVYLRLMTTRESPFRLKLMAFVPKHWQARLRAPDALAYENELHHSRTLGACGIVALGPDAKSSIPTLIDLLNDKDPDVRCTAVFALRSLGPVAMEALPSLIKCLKDPDSGVRFFVILSLGEIHQEPELAIPILMEYLNPKTQDWKMEALWSLYQFGPAAKPAVPAVLKLLKDGDAVVGSYASDVLKHLDPEAAAKAGVQ